MLSINSKVSFAGRIQNISRQLSVAVLILLALKADAQGSFINMERSVYQRGDTVTFGCNIDQFKRDSIHFATLYLTVENTETKQHWLYRYPIVDGYAGANIAIGPSIKNGNYAFKFFVRKYFFALLGKVEDESLLPLTYSSTTHDSETFFGKVTTDKKGRFLVNGVLFEDTCHFAFTRPKEDLKSVTNIKIETPLDSAFIPYLSQTAFIQVGKKEASQKQTKEEMLAAYKASPDTFYRPSEASSSTLAEVTVTGLRQKKIDVFNKEYSGGAFRDGASLIFDGLEDDRIAWSKSVFDFLEGRTHITFRTRALTGRPPINGVPERTLVIQWQGHDNFAGDSNVDFFIDEIMITDPVQTVPFIKTSDIAMIKIYPPPSFLAGGGKNAAVAIYLKHGDYHEEPSKNKFKVFGYSPTETAWH